MFPILFRHGNFILASWHVFFVIGAFAGWYGMQKLRSAVLPAYSAGQIDRLFVVLYISGYFGARIFSIFFEDGIHSISEFFAGLLTFGSMTLYGGIIAVALVLSFYTFHKHLSLTRLGALFTGPGLVAVGLGRIGCFLNGDDYGAPVHDQLHPQYWAVRFPSLEDSIYRYPVQLWESCFCIALGCLLVFATQHWSRQKLFFADCGVVGYTVARFFLEYFRGDERGEFLGTGFSTSQGVSLVLLVIWMGFRLYESFGKRSGDSGQASSELAP